MDPKVIHLRSELHELKYADDNLKRFRRLWNSPGYTGRKSESSDYIQMDIHAMTEFLDVLGLYALIIKEGGESERYVKSRDFLKSVPFDQYQVLCYYVNRHYILRTKPKEIRELSILSPALSIWKYSNVTIRGRKAIDEADLSRATILLENRLLEPAHRD